VTRLVPASRADARLFAAVEHWARARHGRMFRWLARQEPGVTRRRGVALPNCINDKYSWRKLFDHDPRFVTLSDKLAVRNWLAQAGIEVEAPRVLWQGTDAGEIPSEMLARPVVIKANHASGKNLFFPGGCTDRAEMVARANGFLRRGYGWRNRQWAYARVPRRLFAEEMLGEAEGLAELKVYTFGTHIERVVHIMDRFTDIGADIWEDHGAGLHLSDRLAAISPRNPRVPLPATSTEALRIARAVGRHFDHMRVDFLTDGTRLWLGELTVYNLGGHQGQFGHLEDSFANRAWDIRPSWFVRTPQSGWREPYRQALIRALAAADG